MSVSTSTTKDAYTEKAEAEPTDRVAYPKNGFKFDNISEDESKLSSVFTAC